VNELFNELKFQWDTLYSATLYPPPMHYKLQEIDVACNRVINLKKLTTPISPGLKKLLTSFNARFPHLEVKQVWFIQKSKKGDGFQTWHKDLVNNGNTDVTIVVNIGIIMNSGNEESKSNQGDDDGKQNDNIDVSDFGNNEGENKAEIIEIIEDPTNETAFSDLLLWFYDHCEKQYETLKTTFPMIEVAQWAMDFVNTKLHKLGRKKNIEVVMATCFKNLHPPDKSFDEGSLVTFMRSITKKKNELQNDIGFIRSELLRYHEVIKIASMQKETIGKMISNTGKDKTSKQDTNNIERGNKKRPASPEKRVDKSKRQTLDQTISNSNRKGNPVTGNNGVPEFLEEVWRSTYSSTTEQNAEPVTKVSVN